MTTIQIHKSDRFAGDFVVAAESGYAASPAENDCITRVNYLVDSMAAEPVDIDGLGEDLSIVRSDIAKALHGHARKFVAETAGPGRERRARETIEASHRLEGIFLDRRDQILQIPFTVETLPEASEDIEDIKIITRDVPIPEDKQKFKIQLDRSILVIKTVLADPRNWLGRPLSDQDLRAQDAMKRLNEYFYALAGLARVGLMNRDKGQVKFAQLALEGLQNEFLSREAGRVKNSYVLRLGAAAAVAALAGGLGYLVAGQLEPAAIPHRFREFFLLGSGAALGTWLSFSMRHVELSFDDLAAIEKDRLDPGVRIVFMVALTTVVGLLLWTQAIVIKIGGFSSNFAHNGVFALLIGALSGIAERAMTTAVARKAQEFAVNFAGGGGKG